MKTLGEILARATKEHWAVPHFNFSTFDQLNAIATTCKKFGSPVVVGTSEGERKFFGPKHAITIVKSLQEEGLAIFLNADHTRNVEKAIEAINVGYDSIHIDLSAESLEVNTAGTKKVVDHARATGRDISVEGEVGYLPTESSKVYKEVIEVNPENFTKPEEAKRFVASTGVNRFSPAVGNLHGISANMPVINFELVKNIREQLPENVSMVLHGGSGINDEDFKKVIGAGIANIHISTELRKAWKEGLGESLKKEDEYAPYRLLKLATSNLERIIEEKIKVFGSANRI